MVEARRREQRNRAQTLSVIDSLNRLFLGIRRVLSSGLVLFAPGNAEPLENSTSPARGLGDVFDQPVDRFRSSE